MKGWMKEHKNMVAIDPGVSGGIAFVKNGTVGVLPMPETPSDLFDTLSELRPSLAALENVGSHIRGSSASSAAKLSRNMGQLEMALTALKIPIVFVRPTKWMTLVAPNRTRGMEANATRQRKRDIKAEVQKVYPALKVTLKTADALGILLWLMEENV